MLTVITTKCPVCGNEKSFDLDADKWNRYLSTEHIQDLFPELNEEDRERLITGICPNCWNDIFSDDEEDEC